MRFLQLASLLAVVAAVPAQTECVTINLPYVSWYGYAFRDVSLMTWCGQPALLVPGYIGTGPMPPACQELMLVMVGYFWHVPSPRNGECVRISGDRHWTPWRKATTYGYALDQIDLRDSGSWLAYLCIPDASGRPTLCRSPAGAYVGMVVVPERGWW